MKKEAKVEYGIQIVKPWSTEMYNHNELVADIVRNEVESLWIAALMEFVKEFDEDVDFYLDCLDWEHNATEQMLAIQRAITCYGFGFGYTVETVAEQVMQDLDEAPLYHLKEIAEELGLELEKGFIGFN
jgi:hypothetical protein